MKYYQISTEKLDDVTKIFNAEVDADTASDELEKRICADWSEGEEYQEWLDTASPQEISDWLASFHN